MNSYGIDALTWGFHLANQAQTIEMGGFTAINFNNTANVDDLPEEINNQLYDGSDPNAPWRVEAANRIEQLRKANLSITAMDSNGMPVADAPIAVSMLRHDFEFGTAIQANKINGNSGSNPIYQERLLNLDGQGHGFNAVVFENDLKWDAWEAGWASSPDEVANAVQWLRDNDMVVRGHTLVWPGNSFLPDDIVNNINNVGYVKNRINEHIEEIMNYPGIAGEIQEWDVLNEVVVNDDIANAFSGNSGYTTGRELYAEIFEKARTEDAETGLWLNDYVTLTLNQTAGDNQYELLKQYAQELIDAGTDIEGIGFQAHIGGFPNGIPSVLNTLDDFYDDLGLRAKITEFDLPEIVSEELAATYLRDFLTAVFSHPSVDGFYFWSFWDGATYMNPGANLYNFNWSGTPAKDAFVDLLFNEWWTDDTFTSSDQGIAEGNVFKGLYEIKYICNGQLVRDTITITEDFDYNITCDEITSNIKELNPLLASIYPNPNSGTLHLELPNNALTDIRIFNQQGQTVFETQTSLLAPTFYFQNLNGLYFIEIKNEGGVFVEKVIFE